MADDLKSKIAARNSGKVASILSAGGKSISTMELAVRELNKIYYPVLMGKDGLIAKDDGDQYSFLKIETFRFIMQGEEKITVQTEKGPKDVSKGNVWLNSDKRNPVRRVDFLPNAAPSDSVLNLWRGFGVKPLECSFLAAARGCRRLLRHIRDNICKGNRVEYHYFMRWCADMFQRPQIKSGVAVSISGRKGTGKSKVAEALSALLGAHSITVSQPHHLTGHFNSHLSQAILVTAEEAIWAGDKKSEGALKHMITSEDAVVEKKGVDAIKVQSLARIMFIGNDPWIFPATEDERRLFALECGDACRMNLDYFRAIDLQLYGSVDGKKGNADWRECVGIRSLLTLFLSVDLSAFQIRRIPETVGLNRQRELTLDTVTRYFMECLNEKRIGSKPDPVFEDKWIDLEWSDAPNTVLTNSIYMGYLKFNERYSRHKPPVTNRQFWADAKRIFGEAWKITKADGNQNAKRVPSWGEARDAFMANTRVSIDDRPEF
jgi:Family of unknown function (DUF5906)